MSAKDNPLSFFFFQNFPFSAGVPPKLSQTSDAQNTAGPGRLAFIFVEVLMFPGGVSPLDFPEALCGGKKHGFWEEGDV